MQELWYHSPVRFYTNKEDHMDMTNPQNTSFFGGHRSYPLEVGEWHRFLIPMYYDALEEGVYDIYLINDTTRVKINSYIAIKDGSLKHISFKVDEELEGCLEIAGSNGKTFFYSNCVRFVNSEDVYGRKFIKIATKHTYNKNSFDFEDEGAWFITTIPAYCLGISRVDAEISNNRVGGNSSLRVKDSYTDEVVKYEIDANGDPNILNFIQANISNDYFFIDGVQKTCLEKLERDDFSMLGTIEFANVKDDRGVNIPFEDVFSFTDIYLRPIEHTPNRHESKRLPETFNEISIKFNQDFTLTSNINKRINIYKDRALFLSKRVNEVVKDGFTLKILQNQQLVKGAYSVVIDKDFLTPVSRSSAWNDENYAWNFNVLQESPLSLDITWLEGNTTENKSGELNVIEVQHSHNMLLVNTENDFIKDLYWELDYGNGFFTYEEARRVFEVRLKTGQTKVRLKGISHEGKIIYSNTLQYIKY